MALNTSNKTSLSFKKLFGKAHTQQGFALASEGISSNIQIANTTIFGQTINPLPVTDLGLSATGATDGIVEKVRFEIDIIPDTFIGPNQSQGYRLKLPSAYAGNLSDTYSGGTYLHEALGKLQIIPTLYGTLKSDGTTEYDPTLLDTNENVINKFDAINWNLDPYNGILFVQDPPSNYDVSSNRPAFLEAYLYVGSFIDNQSGDKLQRNIVQNNHGFERGTVISYSGGSFIRALSIDGQPEVIGIVSQSGSTNNFIYISSGYFEDISGIQDEFGNSLSGETVYYLSDTQPGKLIPNEPISVNDIIKPILYVLNTDTDAQVLPYRGNIIPTGSTGGGTGVVSVQNVGGGVPVGVTSSGTSTVELRTFEGLNGIDVTQNGNLVELRLGGELTQPTTIVNSGNTLTFNGQPIRYNAGINFSNENDIINKAYVDAVASGLQPKESVRVATTTGDTNIDLTGGTFGGTIDGILLNDGDRALIKNQDVNQEQNGIYEYSASTSAFTRTEDADGVNLKANIFTFVEEGSVNADKGYVLITNNPITADTTPLVFSIFTTQGNIVGGDGIEKVGTTLNIDLASNSGLGFNSGQLEANVANGLSKVGNNIVLGGTLTGNTTISSGGNGLSFGSGSLVTLTPNSLAFGLSSKGCGYTSFAVGNTAQACGTFSSSIGFYSEANGFASHAINNCTYAIGYSSFSAGRCTNACGTVSQTQGFLTQTDGCGAFSSGIGFNNTKRVFSSGTTSFNHSENDTNQIAGHGAIANNSAILGGRNHNIESGNTRSAIIGGDGIKLTGTTYIDTTAVDNLAIMSEPTSGNSTQILTRNETTGVVEYTSSSEFGGETITANNGLTKIGSNIVLGGTLTGDTFVDTATNDISISDSGVITSSNINNSIFGGQDNLISGTSKYSSIINGLSSCVVISHANTGWNTVFGEANRIEGNRINNSIFGGYNNCMCNTTGSIFNGVMFGSQNAMSGTSQIIGASVIIGGSKICTNAGFTIAGGLCAEATGQGSIALGFDTSANDSGFGSAPNIIASGIRAINISSNNASQIQGHGALSDQSVILGGLNNHIDTGNTRAVIIGGEGIKLTGGTSYSGHTVVGDLAIYNEPTSGNSTQILTRNETTGIVEYTSSSEFGGETITANNGLTKIGSNIVLGGTFTGDTTINTGKNGLAIGGSVISTGSYSFSFGNGTCVTSNDGFGLGRSLTVTGASSAAMNENNVAAGNRSFVIGCNNCAIGNVSFATGNRSYSIGNISNSHGSNTSAIGDYSHSSGKGSSGGDYRILSCGYGAFNHSINNELQTLGHGANAYGSVILGGLNNHIDTGNTRSAIIGGDGIKLTGTTYIDTTAVDNLAIMSEPTSGNSTQILTRNETTGVVEYTSSSEFGGETITANNGLTKIGSNIVLGGTLTGNTTINTNSFGVAIGTGTTINNNHSFAQGINALATGTSSIALAGGRAGGSYSISIGQTYNSCLVGDRSVVIGHKAVDYGNSNTISIGYYAYNSGGNNSIAIGRSAYTFGGCNNLALGYGAAINNSSYGLAIGRSAKARVNYSIAIGCGAQVCNNAMNSIAFGNNNILQNNCGAVLIGGSGRTITSSNYNDHVIISNLAIETIPTSGNSAQILTRNETTGVVEYRPVSNIGTEFNIVSLSANTTLNNNDGVALVDTSTSGITINLPISPLNGKALYIKDYVGNATANNVVISGNTKNIDGSSSILINTNYGSYRLIYSEDNDEWFILSFFN